MIMISARWLFVFCILSFIFILSMLPLNLKKQIPKTAHAYECRIENIIVNKNAEAIIQKYIKHYRHVCLPSGFYYYDWDDRPSNICIPVTDINDMIIQCEVKDD